MKLYQKQKQSITRAVQAGAPKVRIDLTEAQIEALKNTSYIVLALAATAGVITLAAIAPNIFVALDKIFGKKQRGFTRGETIQKRGQKIINSFYYLKSSGYIELIPTDYGFDLRVTKKGNKKLQRLDFDTLQVKKPKQWPKTWWIVLADIPSKQFRRQADFLREKLKAMDFYPLQRTVWVYPFDPREEVEAVATFYRIDQFVTTMEARQLDPSDENILKEFFQQKKII